MNEMHHTMNEGHTGTSGDMSTNDGSISSTQSCNQMRYNCGDNNCSQYDGNRHAPSSSTSHAPSIPSSRWVPPKGRTANSVSQSSSNAMAGSLYRQTISSGKSNKKYENRNNGVGEGQRGGGKAKRQRRHNSNDTHNQRNQHRSTSSRPRPKKNIISPESTSFLSSSSSSTTTQQQSQSSNDTSCTNISNDDAMPKLDPNNNTHARRIQQRRRQVMFGKNTAGYEEYIKKMPKHKRPRNRKSLDCPMTPDYLLDIPTKRWQGLMNAW